ncbi:MAG: hypothetical protein ABEK16_00910 [Candidatus Nanohalobium sp.]
MDRWKVIGLLLLAVLASGCGESQGQGIVVSELSVEPSSIRAGRPVSVNMQVVNAGMLKGSINVGDPSTGDAILTNHCPDYFSVQDFSASSTRDSGSQKTYTVGKGEVARFFWRLNQDKPDEIPLQGYTCNMKFEVPFNYSVRAYKQIQVKRSRNVSGTPKLATDISPGPLSIDMKIIGSTAARKNTIIRGDNASLYLTAYNQEKDESAYQGLININDIRINGGGAISVGESCGKRDSVTLVSGNQEIYRCDIDYSELTAPSVRGEIEVQIDYTFVKQVGERKVKVKYVGQ